MPQLCGRQLAQRHLPQGRRGGFPQQVRPLPLGRRPDRPLRPHPARGPRRGRARSRAQAAAGLPAARQRAAGDGRRGPPTPRPCCATCRRRSWPSRRSSSSSSPGCAAPASSTKPRRSPCSRRPPRPRRGGTSASSWRATCSRRDIAAEAYAVTVPHGQTKGVAFAEAEFLAGWIALRHLKKTADALKHFQTLHDGAPTDAARSRGRLLARPRARDRGTFQGGDGLVRPRRRLRPDLLRPARGAACCRAARGRCRAIPRPRPPTSRRWPAASWSRWRAIIGQAGEPERTRPFLLRLARQVTTPGETLLLAELAAELKRPDVALVIARRRRTAASSCSTPCSRWWTSAPPDRSSGRWRLP